MKIFLITLFLFTYTHFSYSQQISNDQIKHTGAGFVISGLTYTTIYATTKNKKLAFYLSFGSSLLAGFAKEYADSREFNSKLDTGEALATGVGGLVASTSFSLFIGKKKKTKDVALVN
ncbi:hypothetical protein LG651_12130 [Tamlana sp. 62-3]|uniref:Uncharacterized protein n=1 Tax=Neotamlana sargassicola TaxID=2883125 RepID=A0A9X1I702_9FLAO|nr:hypothetical protein [Tamlana sargassicola]MCB4808997.1 hypothetical protein [Tamlana sargassicola]